MQSIGKMLESCKNGGPATPQKRTRKATYEHSLAINRVSNEKITKQIQ